MRVLIGLWFALQIASVAIAESPQTPSSIPDRLVVLTFDDSSKSHFTIVRPILKQYSFGATFFITEGFDFPTNKTAYMTWDEIRALHEDGFEIGNHTRDHLGITEKTIGRLEAQLTGIEMRCRENDIPAPVSFAWPGNAFTTQAFETLQRHGIRFARRGGAPEYPYEAGKGFAYEAEKDHPLLVPSAGDARPNWTLAKLIEAVEQARDGRIAVLQFHGVPDTAHGWVSLDEGDFAAYMKYLALNQYHVIAMRDVSKYVDSTVWPEDPLKIIQTRQAKVSAIPAASKQ